MSSFDFKLHKHQMCDIQILDPHAKDWSEID